MTTNLYSRIDTRDYDRRIFVDKYDNNEVWLSVQLNGGGANCVLSIKQAKALIEALGKVVAAEETTA